MEDDLFVCRWKTSILKHKSPEFMGVACYADDVVLIAPCQQAMQMMITCVEDFAARYNITFSTDPDPKNSKSKCIFVVGKRRGLSKPAPLTLCGHQLPWVESAVHLGHELHESGLMEHDASVKRAQSDMRIVRGTGGRPPEPIAGK